MNVPNVDGLTVQLNVPVLIVGAGPCGLTAALAAKNAAAMSLYSNAMRARLAVRHCHLAWSPRRSRVFSDQKESMIHQRY